MEIADYLKVARQRLWILVLVPLLAVSAALLYLVMAPKTYSSTATVLTPSLVGTAYSQFSGPQANAQFVSAFAASAQDPAVVARTAKDAGTTEANLAHNVEVAQVGASSNVTLTYSGQNSASVQPIAQAMATNALTNIYLAQGAVADSQAADAKKALDAANKAVNDYVVKLGVGEPTSAYQAAVGQVSWLQQTQANYAAVGNRTSANQIEGAIEDAQEQAQTIGAALPAYNALRSTQSAAADTYQSVLGEQRKIKAQLAAAAAPGVIQTSAASRDTTLASVLRLIVPVFGAGVLLAIILVALLEFMGAVRRQSRDGDDDVQPHEEEADVHVLTESDLRALRRSDRQDSADVLMGRW